jgi:hypothetical protein
MTTNENIAAMLEQALGILQNAAASAATLKLAAEEARGAVRAIDEANEAAPKRRAGVLANAKPLADMVASLEAIDGENKTRALQREVAVAVAAALDGRVRDAEKAESERDWARSPFAAYSALAARACQLLVSDVTIRRLARNAYLQVPRPHSVALSYELGDLPRMIATPDVLSSMILPRFSDGNGNRSAHNFWPPRSGSYDENLRSQNFEFDADAALVAELANLSQGRPASESAVDRALAKVDAVLVAEFGKVIAAIAELKSRDALGRVSQWIVLPSMGPTALAAE